jgi:hypothetical protein
MDIYRYLDQVREAQIVLADYRRVLNSQISDRQRALAKHERDVRALRTSGQLEMEGLDNLKPSPEIEAIIRNPTGEIG